MTSMALISSLMRRDPRSAHMADPPAPAMSSAVATGACSRTTASTMAAPNWDWAPICWSSEPTSSAMTMPKGMDSRISGSVVTRARNQHWSKNSVTGTPLSGPAAAPRRRWRTCCRSRGRRWRSCRRRSTGRLGRGRHAGGIRTAARGAEPAGHLVTAERLGGARGPAGRDVSHVTRLGQRRPPFRGLSWTLRATTPVPPSISLR